MPWMNRWCSVSAASNNGSKRTIEQTKSRPRHSNDNGLVESKNGAVIRNQDESTGCGKLLACRVDNPVDASSPNKKCQNHQKTARTNQ